MNDCICLKVEILVTYVLAVLVISGLNSSGVGTMGRGARNLTLNFCRTVDKIEHLGYFKLLVFKYILWLPAEGAALRGCVLYWPSPRGSTVGSRARANPMQSWYSRPISLYLARSDSGTSRRLVHAAFVLD